MLLQPLIRSLVLALVLGSSAMAQTLQSPLVDSAKMIPDEQVPQVVAAIDDLRITRDIWLVVWTIDDLAGESIESASVTQFKKWQIGEAKKDNGLLLVIAPKERKMRLEVGYGLEGDIPDIRAKSLLDKHLRPNLKKNDLAAGVLAIISELSNQPLAQSTETHPPETEIPAEFKKRVIDLDSTLDQDSMKYMYNQIKWRSEEGVDLWLFFGNGPESELVIGRTQIENRKRQVVLYLDMLNRSAKLANQPDFGDRVFWEEFVNDLTRAMRDRHIDNALGSTNGKLRDEIYTLEFEEERKQNQAEDALMAKRIFSIWSLAIGVLSLILGLKFEGKIKRVLAEGFRARDHQKFQFKVDKFVTFYKTTIPPSLLLLAVCIYFFNNYETHLDTALLFACATGAIFLGYVFACDWTYRAMEPSDLSAERKMLLIKILGIPASGTSSGGSSSGSGSSSRSSSSSRSYSGGGRSGGGGASSSW
jgi:uncharacterized membrane protein YgcG